MATTLKEIINGLKTKRELLIRKHDSLLHEYREYQSYYRKEDGRKAEEEADMRYYCYMMDLCGVGPYEEGKFSLHYTSLRSRMEENKKTRNTLNEHIKTVKQELKRAHQMCQSLKITH